MSSNTIVKDTAVNKPQLLEVHNQRLRVYNNQSTQDVLDVNLTGGSGHGLATEATLDSFRTENATNLGAIDSTLTDGTAVVKVMGSEDPADPAANQHQLHLDGSGNVQANVVNTINVAPANNTNSGITNDPANSVAVGLRARTSINDAATETFLQCDTNGHLQCDIVSGGGGSSVSETDGGQSLAIADATQGTSNTITTTGYRELSISLETNNSTDLYAYTQASRDNATWFFLGSYTNGGTIDISPNWDNSAFVGGIQIKADFPYYRVFKDNQSGGAETLVINYAMKS
tara:strand:- start:12341 stop:13204 length:864 start_codon:yes stop_codon:yes gene_type:complete